MAIETTGFWSENEAESSHENPLDNSTMTCPQGWTGLKYGSPTGFISSSILKFESNDPFEYVANRAREVLGDDFAIHLWKMPDGSFKARVYHNSSGPILGWNPQPGTSYETSRQVFEYASLGRRCQSILRDASIPASCDVFAVATAIESFLDKHGPVTWARVIVHDGKARFQFKQLDNAPGWRYLDPNLGRSSGTMLAVEYEWGQANDGDGCRIVYRDVRAPDVGHALSTILKDFQGEFPGMTALRVSPYPRLRTAPNPWPDDYKQDAWENSRETAFTIFYKEPNEMSPILNPSMIKSPRDPFRIPVPLTKIPPEPLTEPLTETSSKKYDPPMSNNTKLDAVSTTLTTSAGNYARGAAMAAKLAPCKEVAHQLAVVAGVESPQLVAGLEAMVPLIAASAGAVTGMGVLQRAGEEAALAQGVLHGDAVMNALRESLSQLFAPMIRAQLQAENQVDAPAEKQSDRSDS